MDIFVSVVVPVYNVKKYLNKCISSIIVQTYDNYEVLLIDDGSTDGSSEICDSFAEQYEKISVYHKENGGLSDARNYANKFLKGNYIVYIDSDDYVDPDYISVMVKCREKYNADLVIASYVDEDELGKILSKKVFNNKITVYDAKSALEEMCYEKKISTSACGKLIKKEYVYENEFPKNMLYEDLATMYKIIGSCSTVVYIDCSMYHYVQRNGSIRFSKYSPKVLHVMQAAENLLDYVEKYYPDIRSAAIQRYFFSANEVYVRAFNEKDFLKIIDNIRIKLQQYWWMVRNNNKISQKQKIRYWMMAFHPILYKNIWRAMKRIFK